MWDQRYGNIHGQNLHHKSSPQPKQEKNNDFLNVFLTCLFILLVIQYFEIEGGLMGKKTQQVGTLVCVLLIIFQIQSHISSFCNSFMRLFLKCLQILNYIFKKCSGKKNQRVNIDQYLVDNQNYRNTSMSVQKKTNSIEFFKSMQQKRIQTTSMNNRRTNRIPPQPDQLLSTNKIYPIFQKNQKTSVSMRQDSPKLRKLSQNLLSFDDSQESQQQLYMKTLKDLSIEPYIHKWQDNCEKFIYYKLIPEAVTGIQQALQMCNGQMSLHFKKNLIEYQIFQKDQTEGNLVSIHDLICYQQSVLAKGGSIWKCYSADNSTQVDQIQQELNVYVGHLLSFDHLFMIPGYNKRQIYSYVIQRLVHLNHNPQNFEYNKSVSKYPSDSKVLIFIQIIFHLFITFLNQIQKQEKQIVKSFIKSQNQQHKKGEIVFDQINDENKEPFYIVNYENEQWYPTPGRDSIIGSIVLFLYGLKYKLQDYEKREFLPEINKIVDQIVPKSRY